MSVKVPPEENHVFTAKEVADVYGDGFREGYNKGHQDGMNDQYTIIKSLYQLIIKKENGEIG